MTFITVIYIRIVAKFVKGFNTTDAQKYLLFKPVFLIAAIEVVCNIPVFFSVFRHI